MSAWALLQARAGGHGCRDSLERRSSSEERFWNHRGAHWRHQVRTRSCHHGHSQPAQNGESSGIGTFATSTLAVGTHSVTASYGGDKRNPASVSRLLWPSRPAHGATTTVSASATSLVVGANVNATSSTVDPHRITIALSANDVAKAHVLAEPQDVVGSPGVVEKAIVNPGF